MALRLHEEGHRRDPRQTRHTALLYLIQKSCYRVITYLVSVAAPTSFKCRVAIALDNRIDNRSVQIQLYHCVAGN